MKKKQAVKKCAVVMECKGKCYQVLLDEKEMLTVVDFIAQLQGGTVRVLLPALEMTLGDL